MHARASAGDSEYFDAAMRSSLLSARRARRPAAASSRRRDAPSLPEAISYSGRGVTVVEERELWDMPILRCSCSRLIGAEWGYRRKRGLA